MRERASERARERAREGARDRVGERESEEGWVKEGAKEWREGVCE